MHASVASESSSLIVSSTSLTSAFASPRGKLYLLHGQGGIFSLALTVAAQGMARGASLAVVDGGNRFDVHLLTRFARERKINADEFLRRIFVSRGFTCYQMEQAVVHRLPAFLTAIGGRVAMVFGLLDTFYDEQAPLREVGGILQRVLAALHAMKENGCSVLLVCNDMNVLPPERNRLFATLRRAMDRTYRSEVDSIDGRPRLFLEPPSDGPVERKTRASGASHELN